MTSFQQETISLNNNLNVVAKERVNANNVHVSAQTGASKLLQNIKKNVTVVTS